MTSSLSLRQRLRSAARALVFAAALAAVNTPGLAADGPRLERLATLDLPEEVATASDVRWSEGGGLLLGSGGNGVYSWRPGAARAELLVTLAGSSVGSGPIQNYARLGGGSRASLAFSSSAWGVFHWGERGVTKSKDIEIVGDLDRRHGRTVAVGLSRRTDGDWEDRLAWFVSDDGSVRGVLPRRAAETSHWLLAGKLGVARVVSENRVLVVPGIEPGVFVYDWSGRLLDALETDTFFADSPWRVSSQHEHLLTEVSWFTAWFSRHRVIDEVVADERGNVFFFIRRAPADLPYPTDVSADPRGPATGGFTTVDSSGNLTHVPLSEKQVLRLLEMVRDAGHDVKSGAPIRLEGPSLNEEFDRILSTTPGIPPPPRTRICWDLVHAHLDDLAAATRADCVVEAPLADTRLRADLLGGRAVVLLRGDVYGARPRMRGSEAFEARLIPPGY